MKKEDFKIQTNTVEVLLPNNEKLQVKQYLSTKEKSDIVDLVKDACFQDVTDYNLLESIFYGSMILMYTDLEIEATEERDIDLMVDIFDYYESNGYTTAILGSIPEEEKRSLKANLEKTIEELVRLKFSSMALLQMIVDKLPEFVAAVKTLA